jgi:hypothetical protein
VNVPTRLSSLGRMTALASWAGHLAQALLQEPLPRRWAHVRQGVAARARSLAPVLGTDADLLEAAAWLHDIGYARGLAATVCDRLIVKQVHRDLVLDFADPGGIGGTTTGSSSHRSPGP